MSRQAWHIIEGAVDSWTPWASLGQGEEEIWEVAVALDATARLVMVATTQSNRLWHTAQTDDNGSSWAPWKLLSTLPVPLAEITDPTLGNPTMRLNSDGRMELFVMTWEGRPYQLRAPAAGDWGNPGTALVPSVAPQRGVRAITVTGRRCR